jgi:AraC-like DNA-binding protein/CheY-like chemotaxis protein
MLFIWLGVTKLYISYPLKIVVTNKMIDKSTVVITKEPTDNFYSALSNDETRVVIMPLTHATNTITKMGADVVLLDCGYDTENGLGWLTEFKRLKKDIPVIFITSIRSHDVVICAYKLGVRDYFTKPVSISKLNRLITELHYLKNMSREKRKALSCIPASTDRNITNSMNSDIPENMENVMQYVKEHIFSPFHLNEFANLTGLSKFHFLRKFKRLTGFSPLEYVIILRMHKAKKLLLERDVPVSSVAEEVGYSDLRNFERRFKQHTGLTPSSYRKAFLNNL